MSQTSETTTVQELSPEQQQLINLSLPAVQDIANNTPQLFPGSSIAGFTDAQVAGQNAALNATSGTISPMITGALQGFQDLQQFAIPAGAGSLATAAGGASASTGARDFLLSGAALDPSSNPYLARTADAAIGSLSDSLLTDILPGIRRGAQTAGQVGSSRQGIAEGLAIRDFQDRAGDVSAGIYSQGYDQGLDAMGSAFGQTLNAAGSAGESLLSQGTRSLFATPDLANLSLLPSQVLSAVGGQQQLMNQAMLSEEASRYMQEQLMPFLISQDIANMAFAMPGGSTTSTATNPINPLELLLSGVGLFGGLLL